MNIIAYTYEADYHCVDCTRKRFSFAVACRQSPGVFTREDRDEHGVLMEALDKEGNEVRPVFSTDETPADLSDSECGYDVYCSDCGALIAARKK